MKTQYLSLELRDHIAHITFNRPEKANAMDAGAFVEIGQMFDELDENPEARVIVVSGAGKHFCAGIDLSLLLGLPQHIAAPEEGRRREKLRKMILDLQESMTAAERCRKPVISAVHGGCIGAGLDFVTATDLRFCTDDGFFCLKEIDMGMVADIGSLQRLPKLVPDGFAREMAYTGRRVFGPEAVKMGLANRSFSSKEEMMTGVMEVARMIASKSPLSIRGTKEMLNYTRDHSVNDGLNHIATWNAAMILSQDLEEAGKAAMMKTEAKFLD